MTNALKAGYDAYYAGYSTGNFTANHRPHRPTVPYRNNPEAEQWVRGWRFAQRNHESGKAFSYDPFKDVKPPRPDRPDRQRERQKAQAEYRAKQKAKVHVKVKAITPTPSKTNTEEREGVKLNRLTNRFEKRRTKV